MLLRRSLIDSKARELREQARNDVADVLRLTEEKVEALIADVPEQALLGAKDKFTRMLLWACVMGDVKDELAGAEIKMEPMRWQILGYRDDLFKRAAMEIQIRIDDIAHEQRESGNVFWRALGETSPQFSTHVQSLIETNRHLSNREVINLNEGFNLGRGSFNAHMDRLTQGLIKLANSREEFLKLYDQSFKYFLWISFVHIDKVSYLPDLASGLRVDDDGKLGHEALDDRVWKDKKIHSQTESSPRTGCPAAVSFEGASLLRILFDEYRRYLELIPDDYFKNFKPFHT